MLAGAWEWGLGVGGRGGLDEGGGEGWGVVWGGVGLGEREGSILGVGTRNWDDVDWVIQTLITLCKVPSNLPTVCLLLRMLLQLLDMFVMVVDVLFVGFDMGF